MQTSTSINDVLPSDSLPVPFSGLVSDEFKDIFLYVVDLWLCSFISYVCLVVNIIAVVVFAKMGFKEAMNISLTAIAVWDIIKGLCMALMEMYGPIGLASGVLAYNWNSYTTIILGQLYGIAGYVSGMMAAFVAVERCLCVSQPFTVKSLVTRKVAIFVNVIISIFVVFSLLPVYAQYSFKETFDPTRNRTHIAIRNSDIHFKYPSINKYTKTMLLLYPFISFAIVSFCSAITVYHLREASKSKARSSSASVTLHGKQAKPLSARDKQVTKMLLVIIAVYVVSYVPRICNLITLLTVPEFVPRGRYGNMVWIITTLMFFFDTINATANPFILYSMSSQFRGTLIGVFRRSKK